MDDLSPGRGDRAGAASGFQARVCGGTGGWIALGNFEIRKVGRWVPFFPLCIYSDNARDCSIYSPRQGWNTVIWSSSAPQVRQAREAVSAFNPDGMRAGFSLAQYTSPLGWAYNDLEGPGRQAARDPRAEAGGQPAALLLGQREQPRTVGGAGGSHPDAARHRLLGRKRQTAAARLRASG